MRKGCFIGLEGPDATGKSYQAKRLFNYLRDKVAIGNEHLIRLYSFPDYGSPTGVRIQRLLNGNPEKLSQEKASILFTLNKMENLPNIMKTLTAGGIVICDRFLLSSAAFNAGKAFLADRKPSDKNYTIYSNIANYLSQDVLEYGLPRENIVVFFENAVGNRELLDDNDKDENLQAIVSKIYHAISHFHQTGDLENIVHTGRRFYEPYSLNEKAILQTLLSREYSFEIKNDLTIPDEEACKEDSFKKLLNGLNNCWWFERSYLNLVRNTIEE